MLRVPWEKDNGSYLKVWILGLKASWKKVLKAAAGLIEPRDLNRKMEILSKYFMACKEVPEVEAVEVGNQERWVHRSRVGLKRWSIILSFMIINCHSLRKLNCEIKLKKNSQELASIVITLFRTTVESRMSDRKHSDFSRPSRFCPVLFGQCSWHWIGIINGTGWHLSFRAPLSCQNLQSTAQCLHCFLFNAAGN